jgi:hypothetical protein
MENGITGGDQPRAMGMGFLELQEGVALPSYKENFAAELLKNITKNFNPHTTSIKTLEEFAASCNNCANMIYDRTTKQKETE